MQYRRWQRILVPTDFSRFSRTAVEYAHSLAETVNAELHVLHVARNLSDAVAEHGTVGLLEAGGSENDYDRWLAALLGERGAIRRVEAVRVGTDIAETIARYAQQQSIDLIILATHGRTGLAHLLMGSVTEKVLRLSPSPVLVLRSDLGGKPA
jgi:nucleotide-binding universal stress UspA family protein